MNTIYLLSADSRLEKQGGRLIVKAGEKTISRIPCKNVEAVIVGHNGHITTPVIFDLLQNDCRVFFMDWQGRVKGRIEGGKVQPDRLLKQIMLFESEEFSLPLIKQLIREKINNQYQLIKSYSKYHELKNSESTLKKLNNYRKAVETAENAEMIRGLEGMAAKEYFDLFPYILDQKRWPFYGRSRKPAQDAANALLNFGYAFLEREVRIAVAGTGLAPEVGFFHSNNGRKDSLIFDLMEMFRQTVIDRFVITAIHRDIFLADQFTKDPNDGGIRLGPDNIRCFCKAYEEYMQTPYAAYKEQTPREYIRKRIKEFARQIITEKLAAKTKKAEVNNKEKQDRFFNFKTAGLAAVSITAGIIAKRLLEADKELAVGNN